MSDCYNECDYWEDKIDVYIHNQIKESKLAKKSSKNITTFDTK